MLFSAMPELLKLYLYNISITLLLLWVFLRIDIRFKWTYKLNGQLDLNFELR